ncbi:glycosyltransferase family protein [Arenibacter sp. GZD96]|uniref:glycosyltransferase family protein n=1 Tax=Aurantibrevibacter litoralis TaxID=3106030 RepID=UPI002AFF75C0|nr:glycosyltransferase family protein [Arenibacter sp. GZD-96]MEA1786529.1 glycosyltransferase family protein [Arenibacter sp. GZD-96]
MKILYAIQGTGNGHLSRARDIIPLLQKKNISLDLLVSGTQADVQLPYPIKYQLKGLSFMFGKKGGVNMWRTYVKANTLQLQKEIKSLPIHDYDLILNDFEPVSAWACKLQHKPCVGLSHQAAVLSPYAPKPKESDLLGQFILKNYAPTTRQYGFHFKQYHTHIFTPVVRQDIRNSVCTTGDYYTVYLPSYSDEKILQMLSKVKNVRWEVFSKHNKKSFFEKNISIQPITNEAFVNSMAGSSGILCGAGFETPAEALFMNKKVMVIPMKGQYEQQCNTAALREMGVPVMKSLKKKHLNDLIQWVESTTVIPVDYPDITERIIDQVIEETVALQAL